MDRKETALKAANLVGDFLVSKTGAARDVKAKKDGSLVSNIDLGAEKLFISTIREIFPDDGFLSEESEGIRSKSGFRWIIDPLDGTHNFLSGLPFFGCLIALEHDGVVVFSVCNFPATREIFVAEKGKGATLNGKKISVSKQGDFQAGMFLSDGNLKRSMAKIFADMKEFSSVGFRVRILGSAPFAMSRIACGQALVAVCYTGTPWDIAAPALLVEEAGGKATDLKGNGWSVYSDSLVVTNGLIHSEVLKLFGKTLV